MLDLRDLESFQTERIKGSTYFPLEYLKKDLWSSLPPRCQANLTLIGDQKQIEEAKNLLVQRNWTVEKEIIFEIEKSNFDIEQDQKDFGLRLWKANSILENHIQLIEKKIGKEKLSAVDLGCGRGRDTIFLASRQKWHVTAIDNQDCFLNAIKNWANIINKENIDFVLQDFNKNPIIGDYDLYIFCRFMNYKLLQSILDQIKSLQCILVVHFVEGKSFNRHGNSFKKQDTLINSTFLDYFKNFQILINEEIKDESNARTLLVFLAQKL